MFIGLLIFFAAFILADTFFVAAVFYHLQNYTLSGWSAPKIVLPVFILFTLIFLGFAVYFFNHIPYEEVAKLITR